MRSRRRSAPASQARPGARVRRAHARVRLASRAARVRRQAAAAVPRRRAAPPVRRSARPLHHCAARPRCPLCPPSCVSRKRPAPAAARLSGPTARAARTSPSTCCCGRPRRRLAPRCWTPWSSRSRWSSTRAGLDAQASNWAVEDGGLACFDLSTPLMRSPEGQHRLDLSLFPSIYLALRGVLRPVAHGVMAQYHDPHRAARRGLEPRQGAPRALAAGVRGGLRPSVAAHRGGRGASLLRPRQEAVAAHAAAAPHRPRLAT